MPRRRLRLLRHLATIAVVALAIGVAPDASFGAPAPTLERTTSSVIGSRRLTTVLSSNWAGYAIAAPTGSAGGPDESFTDVTGTWAQPRTVCTPGEASSVAFWVGLGGFEDSSQALEQIGTEVDCSTRGIPSYSAWYELLPARPVTLKLKIRPGDRVNAAVAVVGQDVVLGLKDLTRHTRFSTRARSVQPLDMTSAEWIAEAPSFCSSATRCRAVPLTNFGTVSFTKAAAIGDGHPGTISDPAWVSTALELVADPNARGGFGVAANVHGAVPSALSADGRAFSASWRESLAAPGG